MKSKNPSLSADRPLINPTDDRFGYAPFAKHLAKSLIEMSPEDGFVVALFGPWGSGKSTILNFITHHIGKEEEAKKPIVVRFNPWWFSGQEDLTRHFFSQLRSSFQSALRKKPRN